MIKVRKLNRNDSTLFCTMYTYPLSEAQAEALWTSAVQHGCILYGIFVKETMTGYVQLTLLEEGVYEIGYRIAVPYRGNRYALEGVYAVLSKFSYRKICAWVQKENATSLHILTHNGFEIRKESAAAWYLEKTGEECVRDSLTTEENTRCIVLAGGCFWGLEHVFDHLRGVLSATSGYVNGKSDHVSYARVCVENTGFKEAVKLVYDPCILPLETILDVYFHCIDPEDGEGQREDRGAQYRTGVYYLEQGEAIRKYLKKEAEKHEAFHVECAPLQNFFIAEEYHQNYLEKHPQGYCSIPLEAMKYVEELNRTG